MIFSLLKHGTSRYQLRYSKLPSFSTSPCRRSNGNPNDAFTERPFLQSILINDAPDEHIEKLQPEKTHALNTVGDSSWNRPTIPERDANRAPASTNSLWKPQRRAEQIPETFFSPSEQGRYPDFDDAASGVQGCSKDTAIDLPFVNSIAAEQDERLADTKARLSKAIRTQDSQRLQVEFWEAVRDPVIMRAIPATTLVEILQLLDPHDEFAPFRCEYSEWHPKHYYKLLGEDHQIYEKMQDCRTLYRDIFCRRLQAKGSLDVGEYAALFRLARATWDGEGALLIMKDMLQRNVQPDLICYNYYFEARCWSDAWQANERQRLRVTPFNRAMRERYPTQQRQGMTIKGHRIQEGGLKWEITRLFAKMIGDGIMADTSAFGHLITALAREGDLDGAKSIIRKAWDVDVDALSEVDNDAGQQPSIPSDSPLYPHPRLLFVIAHAFGSNNDIPAALRTVDHFSRKFNISITNDVWAQLLEWTFVLSTRRIKLAKENGAQLGQLPFESVESLFNVMTSKPYCIEPTLDMYDLLIRSFWRQSRLEKILETMPKGVNIYLRHHHEYRTHDRQLSKLKPQTPNESDAKRLHLSRLAAIARHRRWQSFVTIHRWFILLLSRRHWFPIPIHSQVVEWERQGLPIAVNTLWRYRHFNGVKYTMATGVVRLQELKEHSKTMTDLDQDVRFDSETFSRSEIEAESQAQEHPDMDDDKRSIHGTRDE